MYFIQGFHVFSLICFTRSASSFRRTAPLRTELGFFASRPREARCLLPHVSETELCATKESSIIRAVFYLKTVTWAEAILPGLDASRRSSHRGDQTSYFNTSALFSHMCCSEEPDGHFCPDCAMVEHKTLEDD